MIYEECSDHVIQGDIFIPKEDEMSPFLQQEEEETIKITGLIFVGSSLTMKF